MKRLVFGLTLVASALAVSAEMPSDLIALPSQFQQLAATHGQESESARLARFFTLFWATRMRMAPDLATYVGYPGLGDRWPDHSPEAVALFQRITREELRALGSIDRSRLTPDEQTDLDLARRRLENQIEGERFSNLDPFFVIGPMAGIDEDLLFLLGAMPTRTREDFETLLARLRGFPAAVDQTLEQLARGLAAGITPPRVTLRDVPERVGTLLADDPWRSPVLAPFRSLPETIPADERARLKDEAVRLFVERVAPALEKLQSYLAETYVPAARETIAMSDLPGGKALYAYQLRSYTTTSATPEEIHQRGLAEVQRIRAAMDALIPTTGFTGSFAEFCQFLRTDPRFYYQKPEDLVAGYRDITKRIDPELVRLFHRLPRLPYGVKARPDKSAPVAYYGNGSQAAGLPGWFLVNTYALDAAPKWEMEAIALHETVPGHHIQYMLAEEMENLPDWRKWDVYPAFSEGWALYAESLGTEIGFAEARGGELGTRGRSAVRAAEPGSLRPSSLRRSSPPMSKSGSWLRPTRAGGPIPGPS